MPKYNSPQSRYHARLKAQKALIAQAAAENPQAVAAARKRIKDRLEYNYTKPEQEQGELRDTEIIAYRGWNIIDTVDGLRLTSLNGNMWNPYEPLQAKCNTLHSSVPVLHCTCGIYALDTLEQCPGAIVGTVSLWGAYVASELGFRAQYAYPLKLTELRCVKCARSMSIKEMKAALDPLSGLTPFCLKCCPKNTSLSRYYIPGVYIIEQLEQAYSLWQLEENNEPNR